MTDHRPSRRALGIFVGVSCAIHAAILFCVPVGESREPVGKRVLREFRAQGIEFVKTIKPKPKPLVVQKPQPKPAPVVRTRRARPRRRVRPVVRQAPKTPQPKPETPEPLEARVLPPPKPEEAIAPPPVEEVPPQPEAPPAEKAEPEPPQPTETSEMVAMAPQPIPAGPPSTPTAVDQPKQPGRRIDSAEQPKAPSAPDIGNPDVTRPAPASGGDVKRTPQIGLEIGRENRPALPGVANRVGAPESIAGPGGPIPRVVSPNPGGSSGGAPRVAALPKPGPTGPVVRRGVPDGSLVSADAPAGRPGPAGPSGKRSPAPPGPTTGPTMGTGPSKTPSPGSGEEPGPAGPGSPLALLTSPKGASTVPPPGASGLDAGGTGGGGGGDIVLAGGGSRDLLAAGPGGGGGGGEGGGGKSRPALGSPWGGDSGEPLYARAGSGGKGPGGYGSGEGGEGTGTGGGLGEGSGRGVGTGIGDGAGPGSGIGEPIVVAMAGPGGGYGHGNTALPLGWPEGTDTTGAPGFPWLKPGLGQAGGGGEGFFGGPHGYGTGGGYPGVGGKLTPGVGGIPGGTGIDIPPPYMVGGGGGGGGEEPGGPGLYGPLTVGGAPGGTGVGHGGGLVALAKHGLGIPLLPSGITRPLLGIHGGLGGPGGAGEGTGAVGKAGPGGIYADLVGTFDIPVGVTNSDYNTDEVSVMNLLGVMRARTNVRVTIDNRYVPIEYDAIKDAPMLWISGHKSFTWTPQEREALRRYVENGGTLLVEDCHGPFNQVFPDEVRRIFGKELEPVPMDDELFKSFYVIDELPPGDVKERLPIRGVRMKDGRLGVIYSSNDYSDSWKVPRGSYVGDAEKEQAYRMGINWYIYILAHWRRGEAQTQATPKLPGVP
jgi:hypothetical protein